MLLFLLSSCQEKVYTDSRFLMGTECVITLFSSSDAEALSGAFEILKDIDGRISRTREDSEISRINRMAGLEEVEVSEETFSLLARAVDSAYFTEGAFNPLLGGVVDLWGIGTEEARVPSQEEIAAILPYCSLDNIVLDEERRTVFLKSGKTSIDLGAIGKGYASDKVAEYLRSQGVERGIINLGGNVYVLGRKSAEEPWVVGLQNPESDYGGYYATVSVEDSAVITSGSYERFMTKDGMEYSHIMDPETGSPAETDLLSVSIISDDGTFADVLSTAVFVLGYDEGVSLIEKAGVDAVLLTDEMEMVRL